MNKIVKATLCTLLGAGALGASNFLGFNIGYDAGLKINADRDSIKQVVLLDYRHSQGRKYVAIFDKNGGLQLYRAFNEDVLSNGFDMSKFSGSISVSEVNGSYVSEEPLATDMPGLIAHLVALNGKAYYQKHPAPKK